MNNIIQNLTFTSVAVVNLTAALTAGQVIWPAHETPAYEVTHSDSSFSFFERSMTFTSTKTDMGFAQDVARFYAALSEGQEPLGADFESVWDANVDALYES